MKQKTQIKQENSRFLRGFMGGVPKRLERSPYKICELDLSSLKASKNLEFLA
nr:hypothetical protein [uncultured Campylobacter sp.]